MKVMKGRTVIVLAMVLGVVIGWALGCVLGTRCPDIHEVRILLVGDNRCDSFDVLVLRGATALEALERTGVVVQTEIGIVKAYWYPQGRITNIIVSINGMDGDWTFWAMPANEGCILAVPSWYKVNDGDTLWFERESK